MGALKFLENTTSGDSVWRRGLSRPRRRALVVSLASLTFLSLLAGAFVAGSRLGANARQAALAFDRPAQVKAYYTLFLELAEARRATA